jgi:hypothetical protein
MCRKSCLRVPSHKRSGYAARFEFTDAKIHPKPRQPAVTDRDKINDLGLPREEVQNGLPTVEAVDRARMGFPSNSRNHPTLTPIVGPTGVSGWTSEERVGSAAVRSRTRRPGSEATQKQSDDLGESEIF